MTKKSCAVVGPPQSRTRRECVPRRTAMLAYISRLHELKMCRVGAGFAGGGALKQYPLQWSHRRRGTRQGGGWADGRRDDRPACAQGGTFLTHGPAQAVALLPAALLSLPARPCHCPDAGGGIRTHEPLRDRVLNPAPLTRLGNSRGAPAPAPDLSVARGRL